MGNQAWFCSVNFSGFICLPVFTIGSIYRMGGFCCEICYTCRWNFLLTLLLTLRLVPLRQLLTLLLGLVLKVLLGLLVYW